MFAVWPSLVNFAEWMPTTVSSLLYFRSSFCRSGNICTQLIHPNVQKSIRTILPLSCAIVSGFSTLIHAVAPSSSGATGRSALLSRSSISSAQVSDSVASRNQAIPIFCIQEPPMLFFYHEGHEERHEDHEEKLLEFVFYLLLFL